MPPPMMKSKALLLGDLLTQAPPQVAVEIAVGATEQNLTKWFEMGGAEFENGTNVVGEQVA